MAKYKNPTPGDLLIHEESAIVCRESTVITNPTAAEFTAVVGQPLAADGTLIVDAGEAGTAHLLLETVKLGPSETTVMKYGALSRGPAAVNKEKIATLDSNGATMDIAALVTAIEALGIVVRDEPAVSSEQVN